MNVYQNVNLAGDNIMKTCAVVSSLLIILAAVINLVAYSFGFKVFIEEFYMGVSLVLTVVVTVIKRIPRITGIYNGKIRLKVWANMFIIFSIVNLIVCSVASKKMGESSYFWFSYTIMMASLVFFSFYLGKLKTGANWFSFGLPQENKHIGCRK